MDTDRTQKAIGIILPSLPYEDTALFSVKLKKNQRSYI